MPWELTGNPNFDIGPNSFLGTHHRLDPLRIKTGTDELQLFPNPQNVPDAVHIRPANSDLGEVGNVGIWTNTPQTALHVNGVSRFDEFVRLNCGIYPRPPAPGGVDYRVTEGAPPRDPVPGELLLGGIRTTILGFDGPPEDPVYPQGLR